ncbi:MAG: response regulator transcription factor [Chloroflexota bacterium]
MRVIVAEDVMLMREGIVRILVDLGVEVVGQTGDGTRVLALVAETRPDVAILDIRMPPGHADEGIVAADAIRTAFPGVGVLILSQYVEPSYALRLFHGQPERSGYLLKDRVQDPAILLDAVRRVAEGETVLDPTVVATLMGRRRRDDRLADLTTREREVLGYVAEGLSNLAIAERLGVTERTVEAHINQILGKLGLEVSQDTHRRVMAVLAFLRGG